jgi:hydroxyethylthiazole kinase-like uncharacterized protein yjeF
MEYVTKSILKKVYKKRDIWAHKGQYGKLLIISGSERHTGSPIFVGMSACRAGCDLVYLIGPKRAMDIAASYSPMLITQPLEGKQLESRHIPEILSMIEEVRATAIAIGPGLWRTQETRKAILELISKINLPMVIDADAVRAVSADVKILYNKKAVLTPHDNEFLELSNVKVERKNLKDRIKKVTEVAHMINCSGGLCPIVPPVVIVLKGHIDVISNGIKTALNKTGSSLMTKGGMGDSLTGICGALLARGIDTFTAACASAYINGKAGELAVKKFGESVITTDLIEEIKNVLRNKA